MDSSSENNVMQHETKSIKNHIKVLDYYPKNHLKNFAGTYIDETGDLNVNIVGNQDYQSDDEKTLNNTLGDSNVKFHNVKYSINDLDAAITSLNKIMITQDINMIERDDQYNKVYVYLRNISISTIRVIFGFTFFIV